MNSHERVRLALNHQEADRIPFDLGGTGLTTIHIDAYENLRAVPGNAPHADTHHGHGRAVG